VIARSPARNSSSHAWGSTVTDHFILAIDRPADIRGLAASSEVGNLGDRVVCVGRVKGSGLSSGAAFESGWACLFTIRAGRVIREQPFFDRREALEAAGLSE